MVKNLSAMQETPGSTCGSKRSSGEGNGNPLQYFCLENAMNRGAWQLKSMTTTFTFDFPKSQRS